MLPLCRCHSNADNPPLQEEEDEEEDEANREKRQGGEDGKERTEGDERVVKGGGRVEED